MKWVFKAQFCDGQQFILETETGKAFKELNLKKRTLYIKKFSKKNFKKIKNVS